MNEVMNNKLSDIKKLAVMTGTKSIISFCDDVLEYIEHTSGTVTFAGETGSGKSSVINSAAGSDILMSCSSSSHFVVSELQIDQSVCIPEYYQRNSGGSYDKINPCEYTKMLRENQTDKQMHEFKISMMSRYPKLGGIRFFDLFGYDSILSMPQERFSHIIAESDIIAYTVSYRSGFQQNDHQYLKKIYESAGKSCRFILIINRCSGHPSSNDKRVKEITGYVSDILHTVPEVFLICAQKIDDSGELLAQTEEIRDFICSELNSDIRKETVEKICDRYISELFYRCDYEIRHRADIQGKTNPEETESKAVDTAAAIEKYIFDEIVPTYEQLQMTLHTKINADAAEITQKISDEIENSEFINMDQMIPFIEKHMLPFMADEKTCELKYYIEVQLKHLNKKMSNYLSSRITDLDDSISQISESVSEAPVTDYRIKITSMALSRSFSKYVTALGGSGSVIAGAASHTLHSIGEFLSNTFAAETHSALSTALRHIGTSSVNALTGAGVAISELTSVAIEYSTWKFKMKKRVLRTTEEWRLNLSESMTEELEKLKEKNISILKECLNEYLGAYNCDCCRSDELMQQLRQLEEKYDFK
ncbi:MAG: dynamin family protein [Oscillospiraceae bacterium]|nr:dynamin family protein [Oscillospiraceae bacterium]